MPRHAKDPSRWRSFHPRIWIPPALERPIVRVVLGVASVAYGTFVGIQIPASISDGFAMRNAPDCSYLGQSDCFETKQAFVIDHMWTSRSNRESWTFATSPTASSEWHMDSSGRASEFHIGDHVTLWLWKGGVAVVGSDDQRHGLVATSYGHGRWVWKALLVPLLVWFGIALAASGIFDRRAGDGWLSLPSRTMTRAEKAERLKRRTWMWSRTPGRSVLGPWLLASAFGLTLGWMKIGSVAATLWITGIVFAVALTSVLCRAHSRRLPLAWRGSTAYRHRTDDAC